jgi:nucleoside-diphosphate-sugar epimerase
VKILVIGSGFLGTPIIKKLESEGHHILAFSRTHKREIQSQQLIGDLFSSSDLNTALEWGPQVIVQTAWVTAHGLYSSDPSNSSYSQFTSDLARVVAGSTVEHLIILGSCAEYGPQPTTSTAGLTRLNPNNLYAETKVAAFHSARESLLGSDTRLTWARIFQPYGPNQDRKRLIPYLIDSIKAKRHVELYDTTTVLDWISTRDIASAISWIIKTRTPTEVDIGTTYGFTNLQILNTLEELLERTCKSTNFAKQISHNTQVSVVGKDSPLFRTGWQPMDTLVGGLKWVLHNEKT